MAGRRRNTSSAVPVDPNPGSDGWRTTLDKWIHEPAIRNFALASLAMVLGTAALLAGLATGVLGTLLDAVLPDLPARLLAAAVVSGIAATVWRVRRRARREAPDVERGPTSPAAGLGGGDGEACE